MRKHRGVPLLVLLSLGGCDRIQGLIDRAKSELDTEPETAAPATDVPETAAPATDIPETAGVPEKNVAPPAAADSETPATGGEVPCIVGNWEATDYIALIDRAVGKDPQLQSLSYKSKSGTIGYRIEAPVDGTGTITATASDLSYKYAGKVQGIGVSVGITMSGDIRSAYALAEPSRIIVAKPTENRMRVKASVTLKGLGSSRESSKVRHEFDGDFPYACTATELTVWTLGKDKRPLTFQRLGP